MSYTAKSVILDIADNYGNATNIGLRAVDFWFEGNKISVASADITCYATSSYNDSMYPWHAFDTSLSKTGSHLNTSWVTLQGPSYNDSQRLICVFDTAIEFDEIRINNFHSSGTPYGYGAKNVVINISTDTITSTVYNEAIANSTEVYDGTFDEHAATDTEDEQILAGQPKVALFSENGVGSDSFSDNIGGFVESGVGSFVFSDYLAALSESIVGNGSLSASAEIQGIISESADGSEAFVAWHAFPKDFQEAGDGANTVSAVKETIGFISESGEGSDAFLPGYKYEYDIAETVTIWGVPLSSWLRTIAESITSTDTVELQLLVRISEYLQLKETLITKWDGVEVISDSVVIRDVVGLIQAIDETISESITATDVPSALTCLLVHEYLALKETLGDNLSISRSIAESITATDSVVSSWIRTLTESITSTDSVTALLSLLISENITVAEALSAVGTFSSGLAETITATDSVSRAFDLSASETISVVDAPTAIASFFKSIAETITSTDTVAGTNTIAITTTETITLVDAVGSGATMYLSVTDGVLLGATVELDDEIYECFVLNTPSFFPSVYSGFDFNSYCVYQGRAFGANGTGIFELDGATDNGESISSGVMTHETDFGARNKKRFRKAYIGLDGTGAKMVMETGEGERKVYDIDDKGMVDASKIIQGREWVLSVTDFDELESLKLIPVILARGK